MSTVCVVSIACKVLSSGYLAGGVIAILILAYLIYVLIKPEKF